PPAPKQMTHGELADALEAIAQGRRPCEPALLCEAAARIRTHVEIRAALLWRGEEGGGVGGGVGRGGRGGAARAAGARGGGGGAGRRAARPTQSGPGRLEGVDGAAVRAEAAAEKEGDAGKGGAGKGTNKPRKGARKKPTASGGHDAVPGMDRKSTTQKGRKR